MRTWITRTVAVLAALATGFGFVSAAGAQQPITVDPVSVSVNIDSSPVFSVTYSTPSTSTDIVSPAGKFQIGSGGTLTLLGENPTPKTLLAHAVNPSVLDTVTIPGSVIAEIRLRRLTQLNYTRSFCELIGSPCSAAPTVTIFVTTSMGAAASPVTARVTSGTDTLVPVHWKLAFGSGLRARVESREGWFRDGRGRVHGSAVRDLLQTTGRSGAELDETLRVPESVVRAILRAHGESGMRFERTFLVDGVVIVGTLLLQPANAIQSVGPRPARVAVKPQSTNSMGVRWDVSLLPGVTGPSGSSLSIASAEGVFRSPDGRILGRVSSLVSQPVPAATITALSARAVAGAIVVSEQLAIPHAVIDAALSTGFTWFTFQRTFRVGSDSAPGELRLDFAGRLAATFGIDRAELRFLDGSRFKTVPIGEEVEVAADITFRGSGRLQGSWDLAGPTTTPGSAIFVRKELVDEYLSFGRRTLIRSPAIKADQTGAYIMRLSITSPEFGAEGTLHLGFVVRATGAAVEISLEQPPPLARLSPSLPFSWETVAGARNYLLEFYDVPSAEGREPAAGMVLPGDKNRASLSQSAERNFQPGRSYWWRVIALGPDGVLLGQSPLRELLTPQE